MLLNVNFRLENANSHFQRLVYRMKVTTCCGCCSLKTGTVIIGASGIVLSVISLILNFTTDVQHETIKTDHLDVKTIKTIYAVSYCIAIGIFTMLIIGALKKNTCLMLPWLILGVIGIVGLCVNILTVSIVSFMNGLILSGVLWLIFGLIAIAVQTYLWLVVYNYRKELLIEKMNMGTGPYGSPHIYQQVAVQN